LYRCAIELGDQETAGVDIFRFDARGKIVKRWCAPVRASKTPNDVLGATQSGIPTIQKESNSKEKTVMNRKLEGKIALITADRAAWAAIANVWLGRAKVSITYSNADAAASLAKD